jgi:hypothetical protein
VLNMSMMFTAVFAAFSGAAYGGGGERRLVELRARRTGLNSSYGSFGKFSIPKSSGPIQQERTGPLFVWVH